MYDQHMYVFACCLQLKLCVYVCVVCVRVRVYVSRVCTVWLLWWGEDDTQSVGMRMGCMLSGAANCSWATGLSNSFDVAFDPISGALFGGALCRVPPGGGTADNAIACPGTERRGTTGEGRERGAEGGRERGGAGERGENSKRLNEQISTTTLRIDPLPVPVLPLHRSYVPLQR
jgi:hypothetical protein